MPTPFDAADDLAMRVAVAQAAATRAEAQRAAVCQAEQLGAQAAAAMDTATTARDYMRLSTIALHAFGIRQSLDEALQLAQEASAQVVLAQADAATTAGQAARVAARHARTMSLQAPLDFDGDHTEPTHCWRAGLALDEARMVSHNARQLGIVAVARLTAGATRQAAVKAREAIQKVQHTTSKAPQLARAGVGLPAPPADPAVALAYNTAIAALQGAAANAALPADVALAAAAGVRLGGATDAAEAALAAQQRVVTAAAQQIKDQQTRQIYSGNEVRTAQANHFATDVTALGNLSADANTSAQAIAGAVNAAIAPLGQVDAEALGLPADLAALRADADAVYTAAHAAANLIPYDPAVNCAHAQTALTQLKQAEDAMRVLRDEAMATASESQRAKQVFDRAKSAIDPLRADTRRAREAELQAAWGHARAVTRSGAGKSVFEKARASLTTADAAIAECPLKGARRDKVEAALQSVIDARARLADVENTEEIVAARASVARGLTSAVAIAAADRRAQTALAAAQVCLDAARAVWNTAVTNRIAQQREEGHGPQRHEGAPTREDLGRRALYCIDPERRDQLDAETGELHAADPNASKFTSEEIYVKAELLVRAAPGRTVLLRELGPGAAEGVTCPARPQRRRAVRLNGTTPAQAWRVPVNGTYIDDGTQPPPTPAQMDDAAITAELQALTHATVFARDAHVMPVLRTDTHGKVFLRTMWPQNPAP